MGGENAMEFRSGPSYWRALAGRMPDYPPLRGSAKCDVAVIGGGISGALTAHQLVREGLSTILVDKGELASESTAASTGLLQYEIDTPLVDLISKVGEPHAVRAYRRGLEAIDDLEEVVRTLDDPCGFSRRPSLYFASNAWHQRRLRREFDCRAEHGFDVRILNRKELADYSSVGAPCAIFSRGDAQLDPYRFTQTLLRAACSQGLSAYGHTYVKEIRHEPAGVALETPEGVILAQHLVYATGYAADEHLDKRVGSLHSTFVATSEPLASFEGWPDGCLLWETARPYFYARQTEDGRAMIGGEDTSFRNDHKRDQLLERKATRLGKRFERLFPQLQFRPAYKWAGTFGETKDGLAFIGTPPGREREYFAIGYGGNGITFSVIAARLITDLIFGRPNPDAEVFRFGR